MPSKRSHGEGTLRHRSDGRWELRMMDGYQKDGSPRFKTFYGKTQKGGQAQTERVSGCAYQRCPAGHDPVL